MAETYDNIYEQSPDHYDETLSAEYIALCYKPVRHLVEQQLRPEGVSLLDLCCGTGVMAEQIRDLPGLAYLGVDLNGRFLKRARERLGGSDPFQFLEADFLTFEFDRTFDIILMINGYHHFKDSDKSRVLRKLHALLKPSGSFVVFEMCVARHETREALARANDDFYRKRIDWVKKTESMTPRKLAAWQNHRELSVSAEDEYKVDYDYMLRDFRTGGFVTEHESKIWPPPDERLFEDPKVGDFLFLFRKTGDRDGKRG